MVGRLPGASPLSWSGTSVPGTYVIGFIDVMAFMAGFIREADTFISFIEMMGRSTLDCVDRGAIALFRNRNVARNEGASKPRTFGSGAGSIMTAGTGPPSPLQPSPASAGVTVDRSSG